MPQEIVENVYCIEVPLPESPLKWLNSYLIKGKDRNLLIDTGFRRPECRAALEQGLGELGADMEKTDIFLTHLHSDHVGLAPELAGTSSKIWISEVDLKRLKAHPGAGWKAFDARFLQEGFSYDELQTLTSQNPARIFAPPPCDQYVGVWDGQTFSYGGYELIAISMPGHTPGQFCLYLPEKKLMFLGDHVLFDITPNITVWPGFENALGVYLDSLERLKDYEVEYPLPGHRGVSTSMQERIDMLVKHHENRLEEALSIFRQTPGINAYQLAGHMTWQIRSRSWEDFPLVQKWFAVGEALAHVEYLMAKGLVRRTTDENGINRYEAVDR